MCQCLGRTVAFLRTAPRGIGALLLSHTHLLPRRLLLCALGHHLGLLLEATTLGPASGVGIVGDGRGWISRQKYKHASQIKQPLPAARPVIIRLHSVFLMCCTTSGSRLQLNPVHMGGMNWKAGAQPSTCLSVAASASPGTPPADPRPTRPVRGAHFLRLFLPSSSILPIPRLSNSTVTRNWSRKRALRPHPARAPS